MYNECILHSESSGILSLLSVFINFYVMCKSLSKLLYFCGYVTRVEKTYGEVELVWLTFMCTFFCVSLRCHLHFYPFILFRLCFSQQASSQFLIFTILRRKVETPYHELLSRDFLAALAIVGLLEETTREEEGASVRLQFRRGL